MIVEHKLDPVRDFIRSGRSEVLFNVYVRYFTLPCVLSRPSRTIFFGSLSFSLPPATEPSPRPLHGCTESSEQHENYSNTEKEQKPELRAAFFVNCSRWVARHVILFRAHLHATFDLINAHALTRNFAHVRIYTTKRVCREEDGARQKLLGKHTHKMEQVSRFAGRFQLGKAVSSKAAELYRLAEVKGMLGVMGVSSAGLALACLEISAGQLGETFDKVAKQHNWQAEFF